MIKHQLNMFCILTKYMQVQIPGVLGAITTCNNSIQQVRHYKHWNPKFKKLRREKVIKVDLPNFQKEESDVTSEEARSAFKRHGLFRKTAWMERPIYISCTPSIFESYVAPEGDGRFSVITKEGAKQKLTDVGMKGKSVMAVRKIKSFDDTFILKQFPHEAIEIYRKAHEALAAKDLEALRQYVTETAYGQMLHNIMNKVIHWRLLESLEPPRVVHARCTEVMSKDNVFGQVTVRFHTQQILSIYDRFGRLMQGSEIVKKDVLEYIVFERHLTNEYGVWRLHGKIIPSWMPPNEPSPNTYVLEKEKENEETDTPQPPMESATSKHDTVETSTQ